jgi:hypothetical protein
VTGAGDEAGFDQVGQQRTRSAFAQPSDLLELAARGGTLPESKGSGSIF